MNNNLSFTANIRFVPNVEFYKVTRHIKNNSPQFIGEPWNRVISSDEGLTAEANLCICGGLSNSKGIVMFHYKPNTVGFFNKTKNAIHQKLAEIWQSGEQLSGLITGGYELPATCDGIDYVKLSRKLANRFRKEFNKKGYAFSEFTGQKKERSGYTNIFYRKSDDTWFINYREHKYDFFSGEFLDDPIAAVKNPVKFLKSVYRRIHVCETDEVFVNNKKINKKRLNSNQRPNSV